MENKKIMNFVGKFKIFISISLAIILVGIVMNIVFGINLDLNYSGGTKITYSHTGDIDNSEAKSVIEAKSKYKVDVTDSQNYTSGTSSIVVSIVGNKALTTEEIETITKALSDKYKDNKIELLEQQSVDPTVGASFFAKSMYSLVLACALVGIYVGFRFRKIGGVKAALTAIFALVHDMVIAYFAFVILRFPLDANFVAVMLTILGYSLNDTIVIYDRVRENNLVFEGKKPIRDVVNISITQSFRRTLITSITTFIAISCVSIVAAIAGLSSILSFSIPMSIGVVAGSYSSICLAGPLYVFWNEHAEKKAKKNPKKPAYVNRMK